MTTHRYALPRAPTVAEREVVVARLWAAGALGVWEDGDTTVAWFDARVADAPGDGVWALEPDRDWLAVWKEGLTAVRVGDVVIVPSWLTHDREPGDLVIVIDPGQAFGTGHHATTRSCIALLDGLELEGRRVLDVGTGTGVLAIVASLRGAGPVVGVDLDPLAIAAGRDNALRNGADVAFATGSTEAISERFDVVCANLITDTILAVVDDLVAATLPGGHLVVSGIRADRVGEVTAALLARDVAITEDRAEDGWAALLARREAG